MEGTIIKDTIMRDSKMNKLIRFLPKSTHRCKLSLMKHKETQQLISHISIQLMKVKVKIRATFLNGLTVQDLSSDFREQVLQVPQLEFTWKDILRISTRRPLKLLRTLLRRHSVFHRSINLVEEKNLQLLPD